MDDDDDCMLMTVPQMINYWNYTLVIAIDQWFLFVKLKINNNSEYALRVGVDNLEEHLKQKRLRWFGHVVRREGEGGDKEVLEVKIEG